MDMELQKARELVIEAGKKLVETGLIARTWGNVSCRVNDRQFVITPSGRAYETLTPEEIVLVNMEDCSYNGEIKPSSEKGIHAECYKLRPNVNFVIHTHQFNASIVSAIGCDINNITGKSAEIIGDNVPMAAYGLPGTGKLKAGVVAAFSRSDSKAAIMRHHGAVCVGESYEDAFAVAHELEKVCAAYLLKKCSEVTRSAVDTWESVRDYFLANHEAKGKEVADACAYDSIRDSGIFNLINRDGEVVGTIDLKTGKALVGECPPEADLHCAIYNRRKDINAILHTKDGDVVAVSHLGRTIKPLLDDFAQICGATVRCARFDAKSTLATAGRTARALRGRDAVLLKDNGALCCGSNEYDAHAVRMIVEKQCKSMVGASLFGKPKAISPIETRLMRLVYKTKYSKQKNK